LSAARRNLLLEWGPVLAWAGLIFWFSAQPNLRFVSNESLDLVVRKIGHMGVFGILALLLWRALASAGAARPALVAWILTGLYAASDEFHQGFTAGRHPSPIDVSIDCLGAAIALTMLFAARTAWARRRSARYSSDATGSARMLKPPST